DSSGNAWVTIYANGSGNSVNEYSGVDGTNPTTVTFNESAVGPNSIAIDSSGNLYTANDNNTVTKITGGAENGTPFSGGGLASPTGVAIDTTGNVWVSNGGSGGSLTRFNNTGVTSANFPGGGIATAYALAMDGSGHVWVADHSGELSGLFVADGSDVSGTPFNYGGFGGQGTEFTIAVDGDGNVWTQNFSNPFQNVIEFDPNLSGGTFLSPPPANNDSNNPYPGYQASGTLSFPSAAAIDSSGNVWVANNGSDSLTKIVGAGAPTITPLVSQLPNHFGSRP
ncbi:MAG TPA: hypothetical protein VLV49_11020, partial [Terriglobales bacterium]|nr:hypothetical protein [Terriglobales bacterium]